MFRLNLLTKILAIVIPLTTLGFAFLVFKAINEEQQSLLKEKEKTSALLAKPILQTIYKDMLDERAEMVRFLVEGMREIEGMERVQLIRANGVEEAFRDWKTLNDVEEEYGELLPEWTEGHLDEKINVAEGVDNQNFKDFLEIFHSGWKEGVSYQEEIDGKKLLTYLIPVERRPKCKSCHTGEGARAVLMITSSLDEMYASLSETRTRWIAYGFAVVLGVSVLLSVLVRKLITKPIKQTADMLHNIAEGRGDLTRRLDVSSNDEVGELSTWFNRFMEGMQDMVKGFVVTAKEVGWASEEIKSSSKIIQTSAQAQLKAVDETFSSIKKMETSAKSVAGNAESLLGSAENASASTLELSAAVTEVAENSQRLAISVGDTASSVTEIAASLKQVVSNIDTLYNETEQVASAASQIDSTIKEITIHSMEQAKLAERVKEDASTLGMGAINKTKDGIDKIKQEVSAAAEVIDRLGERSIEIGKVVGVIDEVAETTNLLALNATILAAQAGENGRGFAVVASEVKGLADRTSASTKEIAELIKLVQEEVKVAVASMNRSLERVEEGTNLSTEAAKALTKILKSAEESSEMAARVGHATEEQSKGVGTVAESIHRISTMVEEIKKASDEQSRASTGISEAAEKMQQITLQVERSTSEQSNEVRHISEVIADVAEKMHSVTKSTAEQKKASEDIVRSIETIKKTTEKNVALTDDLEKTTRNLEEHSHLLRDKTKSFKV